MSCTAKSEGYHCFSAGLTLWERRDSMAEFASKGVATAGLTTGVIGTALGVLNGGLGNLLGGVIGGNNLAGVCSENMPVSRYELEMENKLLGKDSEIALLKSEKYTDEKIVDVYEKLSGRIAGVEQQIAAQAVYNATANANIACIQNQIAQLQGLTKLIVPASSICPAPMPLHNSWTAPTASTTEPAA